jgi:hypothetical protein
MHDPALVRGLHDLGHALEERHEAIERQRPALAQPVIERGALDSLHRDPEQPIVVLDPERIDVRGVGMIEPRRQLRLAHEPLHDHVVVAQAAMEHLDDRLAAEQRLLAAVHRAESAAADPLAEHELADRPPSKIVPLRHHTCSVASDRPGRPPPKAAAVRSRQTSATSRQTSSDRIRSRC